MLYLLCVLCRSAIFLPLLFAKFGRFTPNRLALIGQKYALIGHFHFCRLALIGHGLFRKSLIMNKSSWKYGSFPKICKQLVISLVPFFRLHIFNFPSCRFLCKEINEIGGTKPTFSVFFRFRPPLLPSPLHVFPDTALYAYNQVFITNLSPPDKHISTYFFDRKTRLLHVSSALQNSNNDRLLDSFSQKTLQKSQLKRMKKFKKPRFHRRFSYKTTPPYAPRFTRLRILTKLSPMIVETLL